MHRAKLMVPLAKRKAKEQLELEYKSKSGNPLARMEELQIDLSIREARLLNCFHEG
ncbi:hypothetical protein QYM36_011455, partial [Artemia franciscana]